MTLHDTLNAHYAYATATKRIENNNKRAQSGEQRANAKRGYVKRNDGIRKVMPSTAKGR